MPISRMDLAGAGSPEALVKRILQAEPHLPVPVPIRELCARLGILQIEDLDTDGFEGSLVTDAKRSECVSACNFDPVRRGIGVQFWL